MTPDSPPPVPVPWWKRPAVWLLALGGLIAAALAFLRLPGKPPPPSSPPPPPDVPPVKIPPVNTQPSTTYEEGKVQAPSTPTEKDVDDTLERLNAEDNK